MARSIKYQVTAPTKVTGLICGVVFTEGAATVDAARHRSAAAYFQRHDDYTVVALDTPPPPPESDAAEAHPGPLDELTKAELIALVNEPESDQATAEPQEEAGKAKAKRPAAGATKDTWVAYAIVTGAAQAHPGPLDELTKAELIALVDEHEGNQTP